LTRQQSAYARQRKHRFYRVDFGHLISCSSPEPTMPPPMPPDCQNAAAFHGHDKVHGDDGCQYSMPSPDLYDGVFVLQSFCNLSAKSIRSRSAMPHQAANTDDFEVSISFGTKRSQVQILSPRMTPKSRSRRQFRKRLSAGSYFAVNVLRLAATSPCNARNMARQSLTHSRPTKFHTLERLFARSCNIS